MKSPFSTIKTVLLSLAIGLSVVACGVLDAVQDNQAGARAIVEIATLAAIEQSSDRAATARRVIQAAEDARTWLDFDGVTLDELAFKARERIASSSLELSSKASLNLLVGMLEDEISARVADRTLDYEATVTVNCMLDWIITSAQAYAG